MRESIHLRASDVRQVPWKNGRGTTREFAVWPEGASLERGDFDWRLSSAPVSEEGPFSILPGLERILVVTQGEELVLAHGGAAPSVHLRRLEPYRFDGGWPTTAALPRGPIVDFNVMLRPERVRAELEVVCGSRPPLEPLAAGHAFVHVLAGGCAVRVAGEERVFELEPGDGLWLRGLRGGEELDCSGYSDGCELLIVSLGAPA